MSRCKACDAPLFLKDTPAINPNTHQEEDLCGVCKGASRNSQVEHEYVGGNSPTDGVTAPMPTGND